MRFETPFVVAHVYHWCQLKVKPLVRQGFKPLPHSESPLKRTHDSLVLFRGLVLLDGELIPRRVMGFNVKLTLMHVHAPLLFSHPHSP